MVFVPGWLAVSEPQLIEMLGLNDGSRTVRAQKDAVYRIMQQHQIKWLPGRVAPLRKIQLALAGEG